MFPDVDNFLQSQAAFRTNSDVLEESHGVTVERLSQTTHRTKDLELGHFMKRRGQNLSSSLRAVGRLELDLFNNLIRPTGYEPSSQSTSGDAGLEIPATTIAGMGGRCVDQFIGGVPGGQRTQLLCRTV